MSETPLNIPIQIATPDPLGACFTALGIQSTTYTHPPIFTVEDGKDIEKHIPGGHTKNLFLKDKKNTLFLVTTLGDTTINLKTLHTHLDAGRFSFGKADLLLEILGVTPGSVTPFALLNDTDRRIQPVLDARMMACDTINFHPMRNDKTTNIKPADLLTFMQDQGYTPHILDFTQG